MSGFCKGVSGDASAFAICEYLRDRHGLGLEDFDTGAPAIVRPAGEDYRLELGAPDGEVDAQEVYARAIEYAEAEEDANTARVDTSDYESSFTFDSPFQEFLSSHADVRIPWLFDALGSDDRTEWIFSRIKLKIDMIGVNLGVSDLEEGTPGYRRALALKIFRFIRKAPKKGGMGIRFDKDAESPQRDLLEVIDSRRATCIEFANLYIAVARMAGLEVRPIEVYNDKDGDFIDHMKVAVELGDGEYLFLGLNEGVGLKPKEKWSFISRNDLIAHDLNARSVLSCGGGDEGEVAECKRSYLERALDFSPNHYLALYNLGRLAWVADGDLESSLSYYLKAHESYPLHPDTILGLKKVSSELGMDDESERWCDEYRAITGKEACE